MLKLPIESEEVSPSDTENGQTSSGPPDPRISFGFDSVQGKEVDEENATIQGLDEKEVDEAMAEVKQRAKYVALEISGLVSNLQTTVQDACELTRAHVQM